MSRAVGEVRRGYVVVLHASSDLSPQKPVRQAEEVL